MDFTIQIADKRIAIRAMYQSTCDYCANFLCEGKPDFGVTTEFCDLEYEERKSAREAEMEGLPVRTHSRGYLETIAIQRKITENLFAYDTILFHGSVVAVDGEAYLFTAKSGTGKSTHTAYWRELLGDRAVMVNDDKPFLKIEEDRVIAYGSPWNGKHRLGSNIAVPLKAICILERAEVNHIQAIPPKYALTTLIQQSSRPMNAVLMPKYMELIDGLSRKVKFYRMGCNMSIDAAKLAYETMRRG